MTARRAVRLVAIDLDRTLLDNRRAVSPANRDALLRAHEMGVAVAICSGRDLPATRAVTEELGIPTWLVIQNGGLVLSPDGDALLVRTFAGEAVRGVLDALRRHRLAPAVYDVFPRAEHLWWPRDADAPPGILDFRRQHGAEIEDVDDIACVLGRPVACVEVFGEADAARAAAAEIGRNDEVCAIINLSGSRPGWALMGIYPAGTSKESGLDPVVGALGITAAEVLAIGDNLNDVGMVRWAGAGVMMANGPDEARAAADWVAPTNNESGVAAAIEKFVFTAKSRRTQRE